MTSLKPVPITYLSHEDLEEKGFDTSKMTQEELNDLASNMADLYMEGDYWPHLTGLAEEMGVPKKP